MQNILEIACQFKHDSPPLSVAALGNGLINDTFLVSCVTSQWVLQRINPLVFPAPQGVMENLQLLIEHVSKKRMQSESVPALIIPAIIETRSQQAYLVDAQGHSWRGLEFVANSYSKEQVVSIEEAGDVGWALGGFHALGRDLDVHMLQDTLPGFHITPLYLTHYQQVVADVNAFENSDAVRFCKEYIATHQSIVTVLEAAKAQGLLTLRVMHGDPKVNNFLFDQHTHKIISIIDLDTVKPGLLHYDIGDCLRSCCHNNADDTFDLILAEALLTRYLEQVRDFFKVSDYQYLFAAIQLIPFELGLRFFTDYLQGNQYFKVSSPQQNLVRAVQQFKLCESIRLQQDAIEGLLLRIQSA